MKDIIVSPRTYDELKAAMTPPPPEHTPAEMLAIIGRLNRHSRRAGASMLRHGKPLLEVFERLTGFTNRKRTWSDSREAGRAT